MSSKQISTDQRRYGFILRKHEILEFDSALMLNTEVAWLNCGLKNASIDAETHLWIPISNQKSEKTGLISNLPRILSFSSGVLDKDHILLIYDQESMNINQFCLIALLSRSRSGILCSVSFGHCLLSI